MLLHEFGHYVDAMLRTQLYRPEDGDAPDADAADDEGAKLAYALAHFDVANTAETTFATLKSPDYSGALQVDYHEARAAVRAAQNQEAQNIEGKDGSQEFFPAKGRAHERATDTLVRS